ncbi:ATP-binding cassette domain-containing protein [Candidatus Saccharibacteria bacterium]|nr:ATP-binding cassette domain-containing protein [Candidatus Saccharibacteria bacterium]
MSKAFEANNVNITFDGNIKALVNVSLAAEEGKIFGLLGPNGAGKTTLVRMLSTLLKPDSGSLKVLGIDVVAEAEKVRESIGLAGQYAAVDEFLTGRENLYMVGRLYHMSHKAAKKRADEILEEFNLVEAGNRQVKTYSGGMRRRLDLGASLVSKPKMLFLDEPTTGLDPRTRLELWEVIRNLVKEGTSILLTTQYLEEADELADKIAVIDHGSVIAEGTSKELKNKLGGDVVEFKVSKSNEVNKAISAITKIAAKDPTIEENNIVVPVKNGPKGLLEVVRALDTNKISLQTISLHEPSLDDVFLALTGERAKDQTIQKSKKREVPRG